MAKYQIWDRASNIYTPIGEELTAEQWMKRYGWMKNPAVVPVIDGGVINGAFCGELSTMVEHYTSLGADFSQATTNAEKLAVIEAFEVAQAAEQPVATAEERIAAALEYQVLASMPDET